MDDCMHGRRAVGRVRAPPFDQGSTSTRRIILDHAGTEVGRRHQLEHEQVADARGLGRALLVETCERTALVLMAGLNAGAVTERYCCAGDYKPT
jgi:glycerol kinase